ncbi:MAG: CMP-N-acetylneuraminic acid synthetase [Candidatus Lloydbacteria bacterium CG22_combo_CG10-13_8_21_14_all_47_15]|uniref:CMP-N-acetylneuraminic acid synthetase n=1 Tax=Candidatus Lloydbacteria bacterium CG22_combo_CG10-13_8_21_14_all_47_15 TaxID=1974635 RepID=A0A2H0CVM4_9BACT|nr:MAG: CMP-N-acetylneuraminic acid synthetase [Candidatus Lloydbacteria bacterium CG22_combo_CG10-13_8_21_14_all_47_15]
MKEVFNIGALRVGENYPAIIIAELSDGHMGSFEKAQQLVGAAKDAGADVVKFQMHFPEREMISGVKMWAGDLQDILKRVWFSPNNHERIMEYCASIGIEYLCTPFSFEAVDTLERMGVHSFKTGSGEICNLPFHRKLAKISARTGKPVFISTGMCTMAELEETIALYTEEGANFLLMNCTSEYPINDYVHLRLGLIPVLREKFRVMVGQSDHSTEIYSSLAAIALGAKVIEKHFTLDRNGPFPDDGMCLDPRMMRELVDAVRKVEKAIEGNEKIVLPEEAEIRSWAFHSVVSDRNLKKGELITLANVRPARPGSGIPAKYLDETYFHELENKRCKTDIPKDTVITWEDLE